MITHLASRRAPSVPVAQETEAARFKRAIELEGRIVADEQVSAEQQRWLAGYQTQPEYRAHRDLYATFGDAIFG